MQTILGPDGAQHLPPSLPAHAMTTFQMATPHRTVGCQEYGCERYLKGWVTIVDNDKATLVRSLTGFRYTEQLLPGGLHEFRFEAGQECFLGRARKHSLPWDGRERFFQRGGDWRGNPRGEVREFQYADDWVDASATHQARLADRLERG